MDVLNIPYTNNKDEFTLYMSIGMIHKAMLNNLAPYQMAHFLVEFNIKDVFILSNMTFDQTKQLLTNMENTCTSTSNTNIGNTSNPKPSSSTLTLVEPKIKNEHSS